VPVFIDDRIEVYPDAVVQDSLTLLRAEPGWRSVLTRWDASAVLWRSDAPLSSVLRESTGWRLAYADPGWTVFVPERAPTRR
jgi:hypothetical protein